MSFLAELKRRNVFRVGVAYAITAWLLVQVADILFEAIGTPAWAMQTLLVFLGLGFVIALFFAWAFELTPQGVKRESEVDRNQSIAPQTGKKLNNAILVLMALAIAYLLFDKFSGNRPEAASTPAVEMAGNSAQPDVAPAPDTQPTVSRQSIAVLPFDNRSEQKSDEYFVEGIHDDLLTNLARIGSLKVISRTSVTKYKNTEKNIREIAAELGVATIMEGAVQRAGSQVRINVQLIDAQTDEHLWAEIFDRELSAENLFVIQSEISEAIASALKTTLTSDEQQRINTVPTQNLAAYEAYLHGRQLLATRKSDQLEQAVVSFQQATQLDPQFALAWVGLADSYNLLRAYGAMPSEEARPLAQAAIEQALRLDPQLGEAHTTLAALQSQVNDWDKAEASYRKAIELSPNYAQAYQWYSDSLLRRPLRIDEAIRLAQKSIELDPNSPIMSVNLGDAYENKGLYQMAERQYEQSIELNPEFFPPYLALADLLTYQVSRYPVALRYHEQAIERDPGNIGPYFGIMSIYLEIGDLQKAQAARERLAEVNPERRWAGVADVIYNTTAGNAAGVREAVNWLLPRAENSNRGLLRLMAFSLANVNETQKALELFLAARPGWSDPNQWDRLVDEEGAESACHVAWLLLRAGDEAKGSGLLARASRYVEEELPAVVEHAETRGAVFCQLARGDKEKALATLETMLAHDHLFGWDAPARSALFDPIRDEPRFVAALQERDRKIALQREEIEAMEAEGTL